MTRTCASRCSPAHTKDPKCNPDQRTEVWGPALTKDAIRSRSGYFFFFFSGWNYLARNELCNVVRSGRDKRITMRVNLGWLVDNSGDVWLWTRGKDLRPWSSEYYQCVLYSGERCFSYLRAFSFTFRSRNVLFFQARVGARNILISFKS